MGVSAAANTTSIFNGCISAVSNCTSDRACLKNAVAVSIASIVAIAVFKCTSYCCFNHTVKKWTTRHGNELRLVSFRKDLFWAHQVKEDNKTYKTPAINDIYTLETYSAQLSKEDRKLLLVQANRVREVLNQRGNNFNPVEWLKEHVPLSKRIQFFKENSLRNGEIDLFPDGRISINLVLQGFPSFYDSNVMINRDLWAVTLVCAGLRCRVDSVFNCRCTGHTIIAYEGVIEGKPFIKYADLAYDEEKSGYGVVRNIKKELVPKSNVLKSRTWTRENYKVASMIDSIESDLDDQRRGIRNYEFNLLGPAFYVAFDMATTFSGEGRSTVRVNCHIWATFKLSRADINARQLKDTILAIPRISVPSTGGWL